jgi:hypothetical protein
MLKLNLGAGGTELPGYVSLDRKNGSEVYPLLAAVGLGEALGEVWRWRNDKPDHLFIHDETVDEVYASHVLEHFAHHQTLAVLKEWVRVLKPGGVLKVAVPNFDYIVHAYTTGQATPHPVESYLMGGHVDADDRHGAIFNERKLRDLLKLAGLSGVRRWTSEIADCASLPVSLNLMGVKREAVTELPGVSAVMSMPRYGFTQPMASLVEMTRRLKVPTRIRQGVYWHSTLETAIEQTIAEDVGCRYVLFIDFDTVFRPEHVYELYRLMEDHPDVAAAFPVQVGRDRDAILLTVREDAEKNRGDLLRDEVDAEFLPASTGHFGLTLVRVDAFAKLPKPWFQSQPAPDGGWGDGRIDADIYFWRLMETAGLKVCQANHVRVGHWQEVITWPDQNLQPIHQYAPDYNKDGPPAGV